ncbi:MAG: hypothetical protein WD066_11455 [Planctomycetaceae bacterium]
MSSMVLGEDSRRPIADSLRSDGTRRPGIASRGRVVLLAAIAVAVMSAEASAHITSISPYQSGVSERDWALLSNGIFVLGQLLGWGYLFAVLHAEQRRSAWRSFGLASFVQAGVAVGMFLLGAISFLMAASFTLEFHLVPSGYEIFAVVRPEIVPNLLLANTATFVLGWGWSGLLLFVVRGMRRRWLVALFHALVFHPFAFPVGPLAGLIHALYVRQRPAYRAADALAEAE